MIAPRRRHYYSLARAARNGGPGASRWGAAMASASRDLPNRSLNRCRAAALIWNGRRDSFLGAAVAKAASRPRASPC